MIFILIFHWMSPVPTGLSTISSAAPMPSAAAHMWYRIPIRNGTVLIRVSEEPMRSWNLLKKLRYPRQQKTGTELKPNFSADTCILICYSALAAFRLFLPFSLLRSEEHTSELQSLMRISYAVFCLTKQTSILSYDRITTI